MHSRAGLYSKTLFLLCRVLPISGYLPQDLIGTCAYTYVHKDDVGTLSDVDRQALQNKHQERVCVSRLRVH